MVLDPPPLHRPEQAALPEGRGQAVIIPLRPNRGHHHRLWRQYEAYDPAKHQIISNASAPPLPGAVVKVILTGSAS